MDSIRNSCDVLCELDIHSSWCIGTWVTLVVKATWTLLELLELELQELLELELLELELL